MMTECRNDDAGLGSRIRETCARGNANGCDWWNSSRIIIVVVVVVYDIIIEFHRDPVVLRSSVRIAVVLVVLVRGLFLFYDWIIHDSRDNQTMKQMTMLFLYMLAAMNELVLCFASVSG